MSETPAGSMAGIEAAAAAVTGAETPAAPEAETVEQGTPDETELNLGDAGKKALDRMKAERNEARQKAAEMKARLDALETANMSDLDRAKKEAADAKAEVERLPALVADQLRGYLAGIHKISDENVELYLTSNDPAVLLKQAVGIAERTSTTPKPDLSQGAQHAPQALNGDGLTDALARAVGAART